MVSNEKELQLLTTAEQLSGIVKSCRKIMRKDKGLSGDLDRLPMLTWIMFLKFLDDLEKIRETSSTLEGKKFHPAIETPYRWRDWAAIEGGITGDELIAFINNDEAMRPDGTRGPGLFAYLRSLQGVKGSDRRDVIAKVFKDLHNRMITGYLLRDVIDKVSGIHFDSTEEIHVLSRLYESMLREMRDSAGDSGEFYTPRPVVRFMVDVMKPALGETILDPACGTGGFLVEAYKYLEQQCNTVEERHVLQSSSIHGGEAKPLPYLLAQMNLLLHGLEFPNIDPENSLRFPLREIGDNERVDIILTNPPFGGEEEKGILGNFPEDLQTAETALLFLQLIMRKLKRKGKGSAEGGRAAVVVPNGTLYAEGIASRIRKQLITEYNLHTIVRLPKGVFEPYADIPTNILFFDRSSNTNKIWFYEHPVPPHRAKLKTPCYSKSDPIQYDELLPLIDWWDAREENRHAWKITLEDLDDSYNLDRKNPKLDDSATINFQEESENIVLELSSLSRLVGGLAEQLNTHSIFLDNIVMGDITRSTLDKSCDITKGKFPTKKTPPGEYKFVVTAAERRTADGFQFEGPAVCIPMVSSTGHGHAAIHRIHYETGQFALANIMAALTVKNDVKLLPKYLYYYLWRYKEEKLVSLMAGTANTSLTKQKLESVEIAYPDIDVQEEIIAAIDGLFESLNSFEEMVFGLHAYSVNSPMDMLKATFKGLPN